jgi:catechol 2,3-dioxygenase-like lactoylglutathione lyase family enzyme
MLRLDHVQLAIPKGAEDRCRSFYVGLLGMMEVPKPPTLAGRGGIWLESNSVRIHLGVEEDFHPARKAHPAIAVSDLDGLARMSVGSISRIPSGTGSSSWKADACKKPPEISRQPGSRIAETLTWRGLRRR